MKTLASTQTDLDLSHKPPARKIPWAPLIVIVGGVLFPRMRRKALLVAGGLMLNKLTRR